MLNALLFVSITFEEVFSLKMIDFCNNSRILYQEHVKRWCRSFIILQKLTCFGNARLSFIYEHFISSYIHFVSKEL